MLMGFIPIFCNPNINLNGNINGKCLFHSFFHQRLQLIQFTIFHLENQFIMNLQDHSGTHLPLLHLLMQPDHGKFDHICRCPLDRHIDGSTLGGIPDIPVRSINVRQVPSPAQQSGYILLLPGLRNRFRYILINARVF